jgi:hypothetical protein
MKVRQNKTELRTMYKLVIHNKNKIKPNKIPSNLLFFYRINKMN